MKVALIGYGYWGQMIEKYLARCGMELEYVVDLHDTGHPKKQDDINVVWKDSAIESVIVCTPISTHYKICKDALLAGKHVFCEKPTTKTLKEYQELQELASKEGKVLYTDYIYTTSPSVQYIKEMFLTIGKLYAVKGHIEQFGNFYPEDDVYEVLGVHIASAINYITNKHSCQSIFHHLLTDVLPLSGEMEYELENGCRVSIYCSLVGTKKIRSIQFVGEYGIIDFSLNTKPNVIIRYYKCKDNEMYINKKIEKTFDESNGLFYALENFKKKDQDQSNRMISLEMYHILTENRKTKKDNIC